MPHHFSTIDIYIYALLYLYYTCFLLKPPREAVGWTVNSMSPTLTTSIFSMFSWKNLKVTSVIKKMLLIVLEGCNTFCVPCAVPFSFMDSICFLSLCVQMLESVCYRLYLVYGHLFFILCSFAFLIYFN